MDIKLRQWYLNEDDIEAFRQLARRADHSLTDGFLPECYSEGCGYRWIKGMVDSLFWGNELHYAVEVDGKAVGCLNVSRCGGVYSQMGVLRLVLLPEMCGQGIGFQVIEQVVRDAFMCYGHLSSKFERLHARVFGDNINAMLSAAAFNFKRAMRLLLALLRLEIFQPFYNVILFMLSVNRIPAVAGERPKGAF